MANKILSKKVKTEKEQNFLKGILFTLAKDLQNSHNSELNQHQFVEFRTKAPPIGRIRY